MIIRINLLPHREEKRKQKKAAFVALMALSAIVGLAVVLVVGGYNANRISVQEERNAILKSTNADLDKQIVEIAALKDEIDALKARQEAVEDLQGDRNQPVYLMDELLKQAPDGVYLKAFKQEGQRVSLSGYAQSQERVSQLLRNLAGESPWLQKPELIEVRSTAQGQGQSARKVVEFSMIVNIVRQRDKDAKAEEEAKGAAAKAGIVKTAASTAASAP
jgi:type IV pilus assembly protein PilN